jgi:pimeloyl-ACP methyl ester carboxylesterase
LYRDWESDFTIVQWDQRGSGKTFEANQESGELTIEKLNRTELTLNLMVQDGLDLTRYLRKSLSKEKIIVTGGSWGSVLAVKMITEQPENYHFYVGLSQLVNSERNSIRSYEMVLEKAINVEDAETEEMLTALGHPPWKKPRNYGQFRRVVKKYEDLVVVNELAWDIAPEYASEKTRAAYQSGEELSFVKYIGLKGEGINKGVALDTDNTKFEIPIYLIQGEEDMLTVSEVTREYFDTISAPVKELIFVKKTGHDLNHLMLETQFELLKRGVRASSL